MSPSGASDSSYVRVTQLRSAIGTKPKHRATLRALGLRKVGRTRVLADSQSLRGMLARVSHLVEVAPATVEELVKRPRRSEGHRPRSEESR